MKNLNILWKWVVYKTGKLFFYGAALAALLTSCKKNKDDSPSPVSTEVDYTSKCWCMETKSDQRWVKWTYVLEFINTCPWKLLAILKPDSDIQLINWEVIPENGEEVTIHEWRSIFREALESQKWKTIQVGIAADGASFVSRNAIWACAANWSSEGTDWILKIEDGGRLAPTDEDWVPQSSLDTWWTSSDKENWEKGQAQSN